MNPDTTSVIRDIFVMVAAGAFAVLCLTIVALIIKLYRPLRDAAHNGARTAENLSVITGNLAGVSEEAASNIAQTARNAVEISEKLKEGGEELPGAVRAAGDAAKGVGEAASAVSRIADMVSRLTELGMTGGSSNPVSSLLRFVRSMFGGNRRSDDSGAQQGTQPKDPIRL